MENQVVQTKRSLGLQQGKIIIGSFFLVACLAVYVLMPGQYNNNSFLESRAERSLASTTQTVSDWTIVATHVRKGTQYYTEGLFWKDSSTLVESAGLYGESEIHFVSYPDMTVTTSTKLNAKYFAEGISMFTRQGVSKIYQMTWKERAFLVYDAATLKLEQTATMPSAVTAGWGLTKGYIGGNMMFYASDGTGNIMVIDPVTLKSTKTIPCKFHNGTSLNRLNELEMINGMIWANIYPTNNVAVIDPTTGYANYVINFAKLATIAAAQAKTMGLTIASGEVLNGMAYDATNDRLIMTGKMWPLMWEIKVPGILN